MRRVLPRAYNFRICHIAPNVCGTLAVTAYNIMIFVCHISPNAVARLDAVTPVIRNK